MNVSPRCYVLLCYCGGNHGFVCFDMDGSTYNWFCSKLCRQVWCVARGIPGFLRCTHSMKRFRVPSAEPQALSAMPTQELAGH